MISHWMLYNHHQPFDYLPSYSQLILFRRRKIFPLMDSHPLEPIYEKVHRHFLLRRRDQENIDKKNTTQ